eukprot:831044-Pyramimonas_sp.AAC.1
MRRWESRAMRGLWGVSVWSLDLLVARAGRSSKNWPRWTPGPSSRNRCLAGGMEGPRPLKPRPP